MDTPEVAETRRLLGWRRYDLVEGKLFEDKDGFYLQRVEAGRVVVDRYTKTDHLRVDAVDTMVPEDATEIPRWDARR